MGKKERDFDQPQGQQSKDKDRSDRESGQPLQLDDEKMGQKQGGQEQQGGQQHQDKPRPQGGDGQPADR